MPSLLHLRPSRDNFMYECQHCVAAAARAIFSTSGSSTLRRSGRVPVTHTRRFTSAQPSWFPSSPIRARLSKDDEAIPFDAATNKLEIPPVPRRHLELELRWFPDRVKFADHIRNLLYEQSDEAKALALLRLRSKHDDPHFCTVAWNHVIRYNLKAGRSNRAFELYNDMKKRAQHPDTMTYLFMLKETVPEDGKQKKPTPGRLTRVVNIFESMFAENSKVKPTTTHADAALSAVASDLDKMWKIVALMPEAGPCAPQASTYAIILAAIQQSIYASEHTDTANAADLESARLSAVEQGRDVWSTVVKSWQAGKLKLDDGLASAVAGILLRSPRLRDWDDVLGLLQQVANIPRQLAPIGSDSRNIEHVPESNQMAETNDDAAKDNPFDITVDILHATKGTKRKEPKHIEASPRLLSAVLKACLKLRAPKAASDYWRYFTEEAKTAPDVPCFNQMLLVCSINRSSARAAELLQQAKDSRCLLPAVSFQYAMKACQRNVKAPTAIVHAGRVVDHMAEQSEIPDVSVLNNYISLARTTEDGDKIAQAIFNIDSPLHSMRSLLKSNSFPIDWPPAQRAEYLVEAVKFYQFLVATIDTLMRKNLVKQDTFQMWHARRADLTRFIGGLRQRLDASAFDAAPRSSKRVGNRQSMPERDRGAPKQDLDGRSGAMRSRTRKPGDRGNAGSFGSALMMDVDDDDD